MGDKKSKYYKCKGAVTSTDPPRVKIFDDPDYSGSTVSVDDRDVETVVKVGRDCLALKGEFKGEVGRVVEKKGDLATVDFQRGKGIRIELDYVALISEAGGG